jgi:hypothetical protein
MGGDNEEERVEKGNKWDTLNGINGIFRKRNGKRVEESDSISSGDDIISSSSEDS